MTRDEFIKKWVGYIRNETRDERDELQEEMDKDLDEVLEKLSKDKTKIMIKKTFEEVQEAWTQATKTSENVAQFQEKWSLILITSGWTRQEFHKALEDRAKKQAEEFHKALEDRAKKQAGISFDS